MDEVYEFWFRDPHVVAKKMIKSIPIEAVPYKEYRISSTSGHLFSCRNTDRTLDGERVYQNFMSGKWAWDEAVRIFFVSIRGDVTESNIIGQNR
jgi:hypothetical protein